MAQSTVPAGERKPQKRRAARPEDAAGPGAQPAQAGAQKPPPAQDGSQDFFDPVTEPFAKWFARLCAEPAIFYLGLIRINLCALLAGWAMLALFAIIAVVAAYAATGSLNPLGAIPAFAGNLMAVAAVVLVLIIALVAVGWVKTSIQMTAIIFTDSQYRKKEFSIRKAFGEIKWRVLKLMVLQGAIGFVLMLPIIAVAGLLAWLGMSALGPLLAPAGGGGALSVIAMVFGLVLLGFLVVGYVTLVSAVFGFLAQFWGFFFLLDGMGAVESLKASVGTVRKRFFQVLAFDLLWLLGLLVLSAPVIAYNIVASIPMGIIEALARMSGHPALWVIYLLVVAIDAVLTILLTTLVQSFTLPTSYLFWRGLKGD
jgi:hypothetical protein